MLYDQCGYNTDLDNNEIRGNQKSSFSFLYLPETIYFLSSSFYSRPGVSTTKSGIGLEPKNLLFYYPGSPFCLGQMLTIDNIATVLGRYPKMLNSINNFFSTLN